MVSEEELLPDMKNLAKAMKLLQMDYLGGHGTRGSGRVSFEKIEIIPADSGVGNEKLIEVAEIFKEVEAYELLHV